MSFYTFLEKGRIGHLVRGNGKFTVFLLTTNMQTMKGTTPELLTKAAHGERRLQKPHISEALRTVDCACKKLCKYFTEYTNSIEKKKIQQNKNFPDASVNRSGRITPCTYRLLLLKDSPQALFYLLPCLCLRLCLRLCVCGFVVSSTKEQRLLISSCYFI